MVSAAVIHDLLSAHKPPGACRPPLPVPSQKACTRGLRHGERGGASPPCAGGKAANASAAVLAGSVAAVDAFVAEAVKRAAAAARLSGSDTLDGDAVERIVVQLLLDFAA